MRKSFWILVLLSICAFVLPAKAQDQIPKAELYVGYDYLRVTSGGASFNFNGGSGRLLTMPTIGSG
jgi:hypothetical protein